MLVSAAAGSGKTRVLVERLLARVEEGGDIPAAGGAARGCNAPAAGYAGL